MRGRQGYCVSDNAADAHEWKPSTQLGLSRAVNARGRASPKAARVMVIDVPTVCIQA